MLRWASAAGSCALCTALGTVNTTPLISIACDVASAIAAAGLLHGRLIPYLETNTLRAKEVMRGDFYFRGRWIFLDVAFALQKKNDTLNFSALCLLYSDRNAC